MSEPRHDETTPSTTSKTLSGTATTVAPAHPLPTSNSQTTSSSAASTTAAQAPAKVRRARVRKARLRLARLDPWSVMKTGFLFSIAGGIMFWVATYVVWGVIGASGLFESINKVIASVVEAPGEKGRFKIERYVSTNKVLGLSALLAVVDVVIMTALATLGSFLYNLSATVLGGIEVTLAED